MNFVNNGTLDSFREQAPDNTVDDLVSSFLIPFVEKEVLRNQGIPFNPVDQNQVKYLLAAHEAVYGTVDEEQSSVNK